MFNPGIGNSIDVALEEVDWNFAFKYSGHKKHTTFNADPVNPTMSVPTAPTEWTGFVTAGQLILQKVK